MRPYAEPTLSLLASGAPLSVHPIAWIAGAACFITVILFARSAVNANRADHDPDRRRRAAYQRMAEQEHLRDQRERLRDQLAADRDRDRRRGIDD